MPNLSGFRFTTHIYSPFDLPGPVPLCSCGLFGCLHLTSESFLLSGSVVFWIMLIQHHLCGGVGLAPQDGHLATTDPAALHELCQGCRGRKHTWKLGMRSAVCRDLSCKCLCWTRQEEPKDSPFLLWVLYGSWRLSAWESAPYKKKAPAWRGQLCKCFRNKAIKLFSWSVW